MEVPVTKKIDQDEPKKKGMALIVHDFKQKELIPIKILKFLILSSIKITIFMHSNYTIGSLYNYCFKAWVSYCPL